MNRRWYTVDAVSTHGTEWVNKSSIDPIELHHAHYSYECIADSAPNAIEDFYNSVLISKQSIISISVRLSKISR